MNKISIYAQSLILALFVLTAANNLCMEDSWQTASTLFKQEGNDWQTASTVFKSSGVDSQIEQEIINRSKIEMCIEIKTQIENLDKLKDTIIGKPSSFTYFLASASPYLSFLGGLAASGLTLFKVTNNENTEKIALAAGMGLFGFGLASRLCNSLFVSKIKDYKRKTKKIDQQINVLTPLYQNILARKKLFAEE